MITGEIRRFLRDDGPVKISRTLKENAVKVKICRQKLQGILGREPSLKELEEEMGLGSEEIVAALEAGSEVESIYAAVCQDDGSEIYLLDRVVAGSAGVTGSSVGTLVENSTDTEKEKLLDHMLLEQLFEVLTDREKELIRMRYYQDRTQTEIAGVLGISQVQVSRMEKKILLRMREYASL